jgi:hypothetical protein
MTRGLLLSIALAIALAGCATRPLVTSTPGAGIDLERVTERVFGVTVTYDKYGEIVSVDTGTLIKLSDGMLPLRLDTSVVDVHVSSFGRYVFMHTESSPGCTYWIDPVTKRWRCAC